MNYGHLWCTDTLMGNGAEMFTGKTSVLIGLILSLTANNEFNGFTPSLQNIRERDISLRSLVV